MISTSAYLKENITCNPYSSPVCWHFDTSRHKYTSSLSNNTTLYAWRGLGNNIIFIRVTNLTSDSSLRLVNRRTLSTHQMSEVLRAILCQVFDKRAPLLKYSKPRVYECLTCFISLCYKQYSQETTKRNNIGFVSTYSPAFWCRHYSSQWLISTTIKDLTAPASHPPTLSGLTSIDIEAENIFDLKLCCYDGEANNCAISGSLANLHFPAAGLLRSFAAIAQSTSQYFHPPDCQLLHV